MEPPHEFLCPISLEVMETPVILSDGLSYERDYVMAWISSHDTSPVTNEKLANLNVIPNHSLRNIIEKWKEEQQLWAYDEDDGGQEESKGGESHISRGPSSWANSLSADELLLVLCQQYIDAGARPLESVDVMWENQRWAPLSGWRAENLLPQERPHLSTVHPHLKTAEGGKRYDCIVPYENSNSPGNLPNLTWEWDGPWRVATSQGKGLPPSEDPEGFFYARGWPQKGNESAYATKNRGIHFVRRRKWERLRRQLQMEAFCTVMLKKGFEASHILGAFLLCGMPFISEPSLQYENTVTSRPTPSTRPRVDLEKVLEKLSSTLHGEGPDLCAAASLVLKKSLVAEHPLVEGLQAAGKISNFGVQGLVSLVTLPFGLFRGGGTSLPEPELPVLADPSLGGSFRLLSAGSSSPNFFINNAADGRPMLLIRHIPIWNKYEVENFDRRAGRFDGRGHVLGSLEIMPIVTSEERDQPWLQSREIRIFDDEGVRTATLTAVARADTHTHDTHTPVVEYTVALENGGMCYHVFVPPSGAIEAEAFHAVCDDVQQGGDGGVSYTVNVMSNEPSIRALCVAFAVISVCPARSFSS